MRAAGLLPLTVPEVRRLLWRLVWERPSATEAVEHWSAWPPLSSPCSRLWAHSIPVDVGALPSCCDGRAGRQIFLRRGVGSELKLGGTVSLNGAGAGVLSSLLYRYPTS